ncbi:hypothetical protein HU200_003913 [Digitaria exilis]|uniref:MATH domain-containing protein n=1 Tax=Digitaria exilis TaxID=1010633 RepID=A0A835KXX0_9POAL|nr:hypothetical protein HU200_003913 [Digitaria exilis]
MAISIAIRAAVAAALPPSISLAGNDEEAVDLRPTGPDPVAPDPDLVSDGTHGEDLVRRRKKRMGALRPSVARERGGRQGLWGRGGVLDHSLGVFCSVMYLVHANSTPRLDGGQQLGTKLKSNCQSKQGLRWKSASSKVTSQLSRSNQGKNEKSSKVAAVPSTSAAQTAPPDSSPETEGKSSFKWRIDGFSSLLDKQQGWTSSRYFEIKGLKWYLQLNLKDLSHHFQTEESRSSGASCMVPVETLNEPSSGFIAGDSCIFGVELIKLTTAKANRNSETVHVQKTNGFSARESYTWVIDDFLALKGRCYSPDFEIGGRKWYLTMYPSGIDNNGEFLSLYLHMAKPDASLQSSGVLVELNLSITDKVTSNRHTMTGRCQFLATEEGVGWGWTKFMAVKSVKDWYLVKGSCLIEADIAIVGSSKME